MSAALQDRSITIPFLKWAGGKRWFCERYIDMIPPYTGRYVEPFLGSGALFFSHRPDKALISDLNVDLITTYTVMRDEPVSVKRLLLQHHEKHCRDYYYRMRSNKPADKVALAAWFIYLNRTCWNGLYRVNKKNEFNVPIGTKIDVTLSSDNFQVTSEALKSAEIKACDFEVAIDSAQDGDFVFVDPPYTVKHNFNGFVKYNDRIFSWSDQIRLQQAVKRAVARGVKVLVLNADHQSVRDLYKDLGVQRKLDRSSVLAANSASRSRVQELAVLTWRAVTVPNGSM